MTNSIHKIGDIIAKLRKEKGWTQNELAKQLQVSDKAISKWESNKGDPSIEFLPILSQLFNVTIDYLMTGEKQEEKEQCRCYSCIQKSRHGSKKICRSC